MILQGLVDGDSYEAAQRLAVHIEAHYPVTNRDGDLSDWLAEGDYDGDETLTAIVAEWNQLQREAREEVYKQR